MIARPRPTVTHLRLLTVDGEVMKLLPDEESVKFLQREQKLTPKAFDRKIEKLRMTVKAQPRLTTKAQIMSDQQSVGFV